jgi:nitrite reductase/ring-hydroxylating ferredoxin subunit
MTTSLAHETATLDRVVCDVDGQRYVYRATCPHMGGPLREARLEGDQLVCPWHRYRYDVRTGEGRGLAGLLGLRLTPVEDE